MQPCARRPALHRQRRSHGLGVSLAPPLAACADDPPAAGGARARAMLRRRRRRRRRAMPPATTWPVGPPWKPAICGAPPTIRGRWPPHPENADLRRQVFELLLASGEFERAVAAALVLARRRRRRRGGPAAGPGAPRRRAARRRPLRAPGERHMAGPVQPILVAWARFGAGARARRSTRWPTPDPNSGLERLRTYHRAAMLGLDGRPRDGLDAAGAAVPRSCAAPARVLRGAAGPAAGGRRPGGGRAARGQGRAQAAARRSGARAAGGGGGHGDGECRGQDPPPAWATR